VPLTLAPREALLQPLAVALRHSVGEAVALAPCVRLLQGEGVGVPAALWLGL
jgi:hypothetical protein